MNVAEGVTGDGVEVNVGVLVGVSLGVGVKDGVIEGIDTSAAVPAGAQALRRMRIMNREIFLIVCLVEHAGSASRRSRVSGQLDDYLLLRIWQVSLSPLTGRFAGALRRRPTLRIAVKPSPALPP